jgi:hypothetical protein
MFALEGNWLVLLEGLLKKLAAIRGFILSSFAEILLPA